MAKKEEEITEESPKEDDSVELFEIIKEKGLALRLPNGKTLDLSGLDPNMAHWIEWVTKTLDKINRNIG